ncbi:MAG: phosphoribosyltransferase, partial [Acidimicrobiia bacterium]
SLEAIRRLRSLADDVVCLQTPSYFYAIGAFYADFSPVDDEQVREILIGHLERQKAEGESKPPVV